MKPPSTIAYEDVRAREPELNDRQRRVLDLIVKGRTNAEIGAALGMTLDGAKWNVSEILTKLGLASREEAAEYWRWRRRRRLPLPKTPNARALLGLPAVKWAVGGVTAAAVGASIVGGVFLRGEPARAEVAPFYLEARIVVEHGGFQLPAMPDGSVPPARIPERYVHDLRWWHEDLDHARWELEALEPVLDAGQTTVAVRDGLTARYAYDGELTGETPLVDFDPEDYAWTGPWGEMLGPQFTARTVGEVVDGLRPDRPGAYADVVGEDELLGRSVKVIEYGPTYDANPEAGIHAAGGSGRVWLDPETLTIVRWEQDEGMNRHVRAEVTRFDRGVDHDRRVFVAEPPASPDPHADYIPWERKPGFSPPQGFFVPLRLPEGYELVGGAGQGTQYKSDFTYTGYLTPAGDPYASTYLRIEQRRTEVGLPAMVEEWGPVDVGGIAGYWHDDGDRVHLAFSRAGIAIHLETEGPTLYDLLSVATSFEARGADQFARVLSGAP